METKKAKNRSLKEVLIKNKKRFAVGFIAFCLFISLVGLWIYWLVTKRGKTKNGSRVVVVKENGLTISINTDLERATCPRKFSYEELVAATNGFGGDRRLGRGGYLD